MPSSEHSNSGSQIHCKGIKAEKKYINFVWSQFSEVPLDWGQNIDYFVLNCVSKSWLIFLNILEDKAEKCGLELWPLKHLN